MISEHIEDTLALFCSLTIEMDFVQKCPSCLRLWPVLFSFYIGPLVETQIDFGAVRHASVHARQLEGDGGARLRRNPRYRHAYSRAASQHGPPTGSFYEAADQGGGDLLSQNLCFKSNRPKSFNLFVELTSFETEIYDCVHQ